MKIIATPRGGGKTTELIKLASETGAYIVVLYRGRAKALYDQAKSLGYEINFPILARDVVEHNVSCLPSTLDIQNKGILIDDIDDIIRNLFPNVKAVTFSL